MHARHIAVLVLSLTALSTQEAAAYCFATYCGGKTEGSQCTPEDTRGADTPPNCGTPIFWARDCLGFAVHSAGSSQVDTQTAAEVLQEAFTTWENADCGGASPNIQVEYLGEVPCAEVEYNSRGGNVNVLTFREDVWPHAARGNALALTTVTYDKDTFEIYDADIEINAVSRRITTTQTTDDYDLLSILTHEAGHFLGLAHSSAVDDSSGVPATMSVELPPGSTTYRSLTADDVAGVCALFPPTSTPSATCNPIPRHGFSPDCLDQQTHGDCTIASAPRQDPDLPWLAALCIALFGFRRRVRG